MNWKVSEADPSRHKYQIRGKLQSGKIVKISGHRDKRIAEKIRDHVESLDRSKRLGELPDPNVISWVDTLSPKDIDQLFRNGLLEPRFVEKRRPIEDLLKLFHTHVRLNRKKHLPTRHPEMKLNFIRRVFAVLGPTSSFSDVDKDKVLDAIDNFRTQAGARKGSPLSQKTRREYIFAMKSFCEWMVDTGKASIDPLRKLKAPAAKSAPVRERRPMLLEDFSKLIDHLWKAPERYFHQMFDWTSHDRLMLYWTAVETGFRMNELRSLTRAHLNFGCKPAVVRIDGWMAKNGESCTMPIADAIANALAKYCDHLEPQAKVFRMPMQCSLTAAFHRDLDAAKVRRKFDDGSMVDFHTLRSTAILWWIKYHKLDLVDVQHRARLKTLSLVQEYIRKYAPDNMGLIKNTPVVFDPTASIDRLKKRG